MLGRGSESEGDWKSREVEWVGRRNRSKVRKGGGKDDGRWVGQRNRIGCPVEEKGWSARGRKVEVVEVK